MHVINLLLNLNLYVNYFLKKCHNLYVWSVGVAKASKCDITHTYTHSCTHIFAHIEQMANSVHTNLHTHMYTLTLAQTIKTNVFTLFDAK